jgi:hypothetical protein
MAKGTELVGATKAGKMTKWDEELAREAAEQASKESVGSSKLSVRGGAFSVGGSPLKDREIPVVVVDHVFENCYYKGDFDADNPSSPVCFAFGQDADDMRPHEKSSEPQCETCAACAKNQFGSAERGRGKACKNSKRLMIISGADASPESIKEGEMLQFNVPVTSVKGWAHYVKGLAATYRRPPYAVITELAIEPDDKTQFKILFRFLELLSDKFAGVLAARREQAAEAIVTPYAPPREDESKHTKATRQKRGRDKF